MRGLVVVAHPRSGSNCLVEMVNLAIDRPLLNEPFNERFTTWSAGNLDYRARLVDTTSLDEVVDEILAGWSGLKTLSFQLDPPLLHHLVLRTDLDVIFLRRSNLLEAVVSNLIALQTNLWKTWDADGELESRYTDLDPIRVEDVRDLLQATRARLDEVDHVLSSRTDGRVLRIVYEDLYLDMAGQADVLDSLWRFLGVTPLDLNRLQYFLDPAQVQMAGPATYGRLPNAEEINRACGSDDIGWLTYL